MWCFRQKFVLFLSRFSLAYLSEFCLMYWVLLCLSSGTDLKKSRHVLKSLSLCNKVLSYLILSLSLCVVLCCIVLCCAVLLRCVMLCCMLQYHGLMFDLSAYGIDTSEMEDGSGFSLKLFGSSRYRFMSLAIPKSESLLVKNMRLILDRSVSRRHSHKGISRPVGEHRHSHKGDF